MELAKSVPITKEEDPEAIPANNRPISLLPILSKVIERLAQKQFSDFLTRTNKLSIQQSVASHTILLKLPFYMSMTNS